MKQSRLAPFLVSVAASVLASSAIPGAAWADSLEAPLLTEVSGQAQTILRSISGVGAPASQACRAQAPGPSTRSVCEAAEGPLTEADTREALAGTRVALLDQQLQLATATPQELRYSLLSQAEILQKLGSGIEDKEVSAEALAQAEALRALAEDPALREKLDGVLQELTPRKNHLEWDPSWRKFSKTEMAIIPLLGLGSAGAEMKFSQSLKANWTRQNALDETFRRIFHIEDPALSKKLYSAGDLLVTGNVLAALVDPGVMLARDHRNNGPAALQVMLINLESFALTALSYSVTKGLFARARPLVRDCESQGCIDRPQNNQSFFSGHAAFAFTAAGLICTHHSYLEIYGSKPADRAACWAAMGAAATVAYSRMAADKHYASDIAVGTAIGLFSGMALPRLLHYGWGGKKAAAAEPAKPAPVQAPVQAMVAPYALRKGGGLLCEVYF